MRAEMDRHRMAEQLRRCARAHGLSGCTCPVAGTAELLMDAADQLDWSSGKYRSATDRAAHTLKKFAKYGRGWRPEPVRCPVCGGQLASADFGRGLYGIHCVSCEFMALGHAGSGTALANRFRKKR